MSLLRRVATCAFFGPERVVASSGTLEARRFLQRCKEGSRATLWTDHGTNLTDHLYYRVVARFRGKRAVGMLVGRRSVARL